MTTPWRGVFPAVTTSFHPDESLDLPGTREQIERLVAAGVHGMILLGTVGENCSLLPEEKVAVLKLGVETVAGRMPVLTGVAETTTAGACRYVAAAEKAGVDGLMVLPAMVYKSDPRETLHHFRTVARNTSLPIMVYNNPVAYHVDITPEMFADLADEPRLVAIKESSEDVRRLTDLANIVGERFTLLCGVDDLVLESILLGAEGWVSGLVNAFPEENRLLWDLATSGQWELARSVYRWYMPLLHLDTHTKLVQYIKLAMAERGFGNGVTRAPRLPLEGAERERILKVITEGIANRPTSLIYREGLV
jgi:4-hydroxy-tetrahydrodipicolinate synthase